jgi:predicted amidohydrolase YtcJ
MLRGVAVAALVAVLGAALAGQRAVEPADLVVLDARILTVDDGFHVAEALAVREGRFVAVGSTAEVRARIGAATRVIDGGGRTIIPGLVDSHVHALGVAAAEAVQPFQNLQSIGELQDWIRTAARRAPPDTWIWTPRVYPPRLRERRFPTRQELDAAAPKHPVVVDGLYALSLNSLALQAAGVTRASADPPGGAIAKDARGEPTGLLRNVGAMLARFRPSTSPVPPLDMLERVHQQYVQTGITSVIERDAMVEGYRAYEALQRAGRLRVRATVTLHIPHPEDAAQTEGFITACRSGSAAAMTGSRSVRSKSSSMAGFCSAPRSCASRTVKARTICTPSTTPRIAAP